MIKKIKSYLLMIVATLTFAAPALVPLAASADVTNCTSGIANSVATGASAAANSNSVNGNSITCTGSNVGNDTIENIAKNVVNIFSIIVGAVAVIMLIYGGFRYITSGGDSGRVGNAKNTLLYAVIGLVIVALAQIIVQFVLTKTNSVTSNGTLGT
jgi:hypothetical protein